LNRPVFPEAGRFESCRHIECAPRDVEAFGLELAPNLARAVYAGSVQFIEPLQRRPLNRTG
jgi:hypothetical protein